MRQGYQRQSICKIEEVIVKWIHEEFEGGTIMTLKEQVNKDFIQARKDKDTLKADVLRLIKTEYDSFLIDNKRDMTDAEQINVFLKDIKKTNEAIVYAKQVGREDLIEENNNKLAILESYTPKMMDEDEIRSFLEENNVPSMALKDAMKFAMGALNGKADKAVVSQIIKELLK
jgi:uncharacterized protein